MPPGPSHRRACDQPTSAPAGTHPGGRRRRHRPAACRPQWTVRLAVVGAARSGNDEGMSVVNRVARPLLAGIFVSGGLDTLRNTKQRAYAAEPVVHALAERFSFIPDD